MATTAFFLHHILPSTAAITTTTFASGQRGFTTRVIQCKAQISGGDGGNDATAVISRRLALTVLIGSAAIATKVSPADAAYGEAANVFGKPKTNTDYLAYKGDGFQLNVPAKWNPSKEVEFPGQILRYEDNVDSNSNVSVIVQPSPKKSITDYGTPEEFLSQVDYLLGRQAYSGKTESEGGFDAFSVAAANVLEWSTPVINGKQYYSLNVLTRTADGDEGGKHQLITATVNDGKLYICKAQAGDKRWFKGARKYVEGTFASFSVV